MPVAYIHSTARAGRQRAASYVLSNRNWLMLCVEFSAHYDVTA
jgi:hypothetical protein